MKGKIIYVDFIKKRRIAFIHFIISKFIRLFLIKLNVKNNSSYYEPKSRINRIHL